MKTESKFKSATYSIVNNKCPKCHTGNVFENKNGYSFKNGLKMNERCDSCGQSFEPETGFYYGAMYVSYGLSVIVAFTAYLLLAFLNVETAYAITGSSLVLVVLTPLFFRFARLIWLNLFVSFSYKTTQDAI